MEVDPLCEDIGRDQDVDVIFLRSILRIKVFLYKIAGDRDTLFLGTV